MVCNKNKIKNTCEMSEKIYIFATKRRNYGN